MTTAEKLLVQIFERKNSFIEQVKQQAELYYQHCASKLLIDGTTPPSWLWSPNTSPESKDLNKEELISKLLRPYPQPPGRCSVGLYPVYNNLVVTGDNEEFSDGVLMENLAFSKGLNRQNNPTAELDTSINSPEDQTDERILNIYNAPDQSITGIQRSKSRQKALELRNSARALPNSSLRHENTSDLFSSQVRFSLSATNQSGQKDEQPNLAEPCVVGSQICDILDLAEAECISKENGPACSGRITRSKSGAKVPVDVRGSTTLGCSSPDCKDNSPFHVAKEWRTPSIHISDSEQAADYVYKLPKSAGPSIVCSQSCGGRKVDVADCLSNGDVCSCAITRSKASGEHQSGRHSLNAESSYDDYEKIGSSMMDYGVDRPPDHVNGSLTNVNFSHALNEGCDARLSISEDSKSHKERFTQQNACVDDISDFAISSQSAKADGGILAPSSGRLAQPVNSTNEVHGLVKPSVGLSCSVKGSQTWSNDEETHEPVPSYEMPSFGCIKSNSDCKPRNTSSSQFIPLCHGIQDMLEERTNPGFVGSELVLHDHVNQSGSCSSSDAKQRRELDTQVALTNSDSFVIETEECNLKTFISSSGKRRLDNSLERMGCSFSVSAAESLGKGVFCGINQLLLRKQSPGTSDVSSKGEESHRDASESGVLDNPDYENSNFGPVIRDTTISGDSKTHRERVTQQNAFVHDISYLEISSQSAKVDGGIPDPSIGRSAQLVHDTNKVQGLVKPSVGLSCSVTSSQTWSNDKETHEPVHYNEITSFGAIKSKSDCKLASEAIDELRNTSSGQFIPPSHGIQDMLEERTNPGFVISEFVLHDHVNLPGSCSSSDAKQRRELESQAALTRSDSFVVMEPKQRSFNEVEECNLNTIISSSVKRRLDKSLERMSGSLSVSAAESLDRGIFFGINQLLNQSPGTSDVSSKREEAQRAASESDVAANPDNEEFGAIIRDTILNTSKDNNEVGLNCELSEVYHEADGTLSKMVDIPDIPPVKLHAEHGFESTPERHLEEGNLNCEGKDMVQLVSSAPQSENLSPSHCHNSAEQPIKGSSEKAEMTIPICVVLDNLKPFPTQQSQILSLNERVSPRRVEGLVTRSAVRSHGENLSLEKSFRQGSMESWPQLKRRKIEHQQTHSFTTSPIFRVRKPNSNGRGPANMYLKNIEISTDTVSLDTFHVNESTDTSMHQEMNSKLIEGIASSFLSQNGEMQVGFCYEEKNDFKIPLAVIFNEQRADPVSSLIKEPRNSQGCYPEVMRTKSSNSNHFDARGLGDGQYSMHLFNTEKNNESQNSGNSTRTNTMLERIQSPKLEVSLQSQHSVLSPSNEVMEPIGVDQAMPLLEGFIIDGPSNNDQLDFAADEIDFDKLDLPRTTIERASILAEICRSASLDKTLSHFSSSFEFQGTQNVLQSVSNSHLEHLDLGSTYSTSSYVGKQRQSGGSSGDDYMDAVEGMPYSDYPVYSGSKYCWSSRNQYTSPVGKLWERLSSHTGSSGERLSSNPELTCFRIEEDPSTSEENKTVDENADDVQEETDSSLADYCAKKQPLEDLTNLCLDPPMSVSARKETLRADGVSFVRAKLSVAGTHDKFLPNHKNEFLNRREIREKQTSFIGDTDVRRKQTSSISTNGIRKAKDSINNSISRQRLSNKTSLKRQDQKLSFKDPRRNNILSNVSSFIPLIQKKQEAAVCAGKRDVKVKALETAEAAKRLEEKKENERKMRKEALKLERAKLEEKNLKLMELEKKRREEERKKKDADIISKKRLREVEERKEKEKKKMRLEVRQQQREQQEKMRAEKAEKENQRTKDEQMNRKKEFHNESTKQQENKATGGDNVALNMIEAKLTPTEVVMNYEECSTSGQSCEAAKAMQTADTSPRNEDLIVRDSQGKSYDISPYQCSDDEDEEDDELPTKKYIPSWASKTSVALLLPLQQEMDPNTIFPPESFCSMDEVLLPRKLP